MFEIRFSVAACSNSYLLDHRSVPLFKRGQFSLVLALQKSAIKVDLVAVGRLLARRRWARKTVEDK